ncbi:MAG: DUF2235 domain-containing protein [Candidatus Nitrotoga sp.]
MTKKIVLFSDGTGNSSAKAEKTNVWRLFQALDQKEPGQIAYYDDGVGTSSNKYLAMLGGVFGWGLKRNVINLYKFVCRNYESGAEISGFGFSRGSFTIRVLTGLITTEGLIAFRSEEELDRYARAAYRHYRCKRFPSYSPVVVIMRKLRDFIIWARDYVRGYQTYKELAEATRKAKRTDIPIHFLGLWDTVAAYGMPIDELKHGIDWLLWPMLFADCTLSPLVKHACHALSLDDERTTFRPLLWDEIAEAKMVANNEVPAGRLTQVWFAGVHSNVGGGYPEDRLPLVSLDWMMSQAAANGLTLLKPAVDEVAYAKSSYARIYDSRAGFGVYYRYSPRQIPVGTDTEDLRIRPIIHGSVVMRMAHGSDLYAPISLRREFWVLAPNGELLPMEGGPGALRLDSIKLRSAAAPSQTLNIAQISADKTALQLAIASLNRPNTDAVGLVWDTVWWRRTAYFITLTLTAFLAAFPLIGGTLGNAMLKLVGSLPVFGKNGTDGPVISAITFVSAYLPSYSATWTNSFRAYPTEFTLVLLGLLVSFYLSQVMKTRIHDRARFAWHKELKQDYLDWLLRSERGGRNAMTVFFGGALVLLAASFALSWSTLTRLEIAAIAVAFLLILVWRTKRVSKLKVDSQSQPNPSTWPSTFALSVARKLRTNATLIHIFKWVNDKLVPLLFAVGLFVICTLIANRVLFDAIDSTGYFCTNSHSAGKSNEDSFSTNNLCWASGYTLDEGVRYRITLTTPGNWFDLATRADVSGISSSSAVHSAGTLMKRWWFEDWFKPIARIGRLGNDEYVLEPVAPFKHHNYLNAAKKPPGKLFEKISPDEAEQRMSSDPTPAERETLVTEFTARTGGELFLYVNDAVLLWPGKIDLFYRNNSGTGILTVERVMPDGQLVRLDRQLKAN